MELKYRDKTIQHDYKMFDKPIQMIGDSTYVDVEHHYRNGLRIVVRYPEHIFTEIFDVGVIRAEQKMSNYSFLEQNTDRQNTSFDAYL